MRERRKHKRYDVSQHPELIGNTTRSPSGERLLTMSLAGCGFASLVDDFRFKVGDVIECHFQLGDGDLVRVQGAVLYTNPYPLNGEIGRFYGVRFLGDFEPAIRPIIEALEALNVQGKLALAR